MSATKSRHLLGSGRRGGRREERKKGRGRGREDGGVTDEVKTSPGIGNERRKRKRRWKSNR